MEGGLRGGLKKIHNKYIFCHNAEHNSFFLLNIDMCAVELIHSAMTVHVSQHCNSVF